jgi:hypothetical protein
MTPESTLPDPLEPPVPLAPVPAKPPVPPAAPVAVADIDVTPDGTIKLQLVPQFAVVKVDVVVADAGLVNMGAMKTLVVATSTAARIPTQSRSRRSLILRIETPREPELASRGSGTRRSRSSSLHPAQC